MLIHLKHPSGMLKECKVGFSWTTLLFGFFPALFRSDWKWALIMILLSMVSCGLSYFVFMFIYNKIYIQELLEKGYEPADEKSKTVLQNEGWIVG